MLYEIEKWDLISKKKNYNVYHIGFDNTKNPIYTFISDDNYNFILNNYTIEQFNQEELFLNQSIIIEKNNNIIFCFLNS
jgi:hypothetical protein